MSMPLFKSFFIAGFECSTHRLRYGKRLDLLAATRHDELVNQDFQAMKQVGMQTCRSGVRWHLTEYAPYQFDFSSVLPFIRAAETHQIQVIWDLCHYGYPGDINLFTPKFVRRFAAFAHEFAQVYASETNMPLFICPVNELSFFSWAAGEAGFLNPFTTGRGFELKVQLARAAVEAIEAVWAVIPGARIVHVDPVINIVADPACPEAIPIAEGHRLAQYEGWDLISGRIWPQIGGDPKYLDIIGLNYYSNNQWIHGQPPIFRDHPLYRPFREIASEVYERYRRPMFIAETGIEDDARPDWLRYMMREVLAARASEVHIEGLCWYPILCHPGWDDERHCHNGLWDYADDTGKREIYKPLADVMTEYQKIISLPDIAHETKQEHLSGSKLGEETQRYNTHRALG
jgi:hypothetical protein